MNTNTFNELKDASKNGKVFLVLENGKWVICDNIKDLPFFDATMGEYMESIEKAYNEKIQALESNIERQDKIIQELVSAIKTLNK